MAYEYAERLTALDDVFLEIEEPSVHMHVGAVALFEHGPLADAEGHLDVARLRRRVEAALAQTPRFRQKLARVPWLGSPAWVDDARFNLDYHVRHTALPPPGDLRQLKRLAGRVFSQKLDRGKPLWEMWIVDHVAPDHFALIVKAHHAMVDGISGLDLFASLLRLEPAGEEAEVPRWIPRPAPSGTRLLTQEVARRAGTPLSLLGTLRDGVLRPVATARSLRESVLGLGETLGAGLGATTATPLNPDLGPFRRFDWTDVAIDDVREIRKHLGGTLNDVVLATVSGAVGRFLRRRGSAPDEETVFRVMVPVSVRSRGERGRPGNRVVNYLERLPVHETDPRARLETTIGTSRALKDSRLVRGAELIEEIGDRTFTSVLVEFVRLAATQRAYNLVVTNVPGPPRPLYLLESRLTGIHPLVPLFRNQGLGIALFSYDGRLFFGFNADWDALPDLHDFVEDLEHEFAALRAAARPAGPTEA